MDEKETVVKVDLETLAEEKVFLPDTTLDSEEIKKWGSLPVQIEVVFGRTHVPLSKIASLEPGAILSFEQTEEEGVEIYANGTLIGRGEIVAVGDRLGARILSFL